MGLEMLTSHNGVVFVTVQKEILETYLLELLSDYMQMH